MESQIYYRPEELQTAKYLEDRLGTYSSYARSLTRRDGEETSEGKSERPIPLLSAQEDILQLKDEEIIGFHRNLPPLRLKRMDWRNHPLLIKRRNIQAPKLTQLPPLTDIKLNANYPAHDLIDPDKMPEESDKDPKKGD